MQELESACVSQPEYQVPYQLQQSQVTQSQSIQPNQARRDSCEGQVVAQIEGPNRKQYAICWNCKDLGHIFKDCAKPVPFGRIFCFGCGLENMLKPNCSNCKNNPNKRQNSMTPGYRALAVEGSPGHGQVTLARR